MEEQATDTTVTELTVNELKLHEDRPLEAQINLETNKQKNSSNLTEQETDALVLTKEELYQRIEEVITYNAQFENNEANKLRHDELFLNLLQSYQKSLILFCNDKIEQARNKLYVKNLLLSEFDYALPHYDKTTYCFNRGVHFYIDSYLKNENFDIILNYIRIACPQVFKEQAPVPLHECMTPPPFNENEKQLLSQFPNETIPFIRYVITFLSYNEMVLKFLALQFVTKKENKLSKTSNYKWTGSKDNKNEFVQLVYGLHQTGLIENGTGEITKIVEGLAEFLNLELSKNWQSNHSSSIHRVNSDYQPPIFDKIKKNYIEYSNKQQKNKKTNKVI